MSRWAAGTSLARVRDYRKTSGQERVGGEGEQSFNQSTVPLISGERPLSIALSKDLVDNLFANTASRRAVSEPESRYRKRQTEAVAPQL